MRNHALRVAAVAGTTLFSLLAGCQYAGFRSGQGAAKTTARSDDNLRLSQQQVVDLQISLGRSMEAGGDLEGAVNAYRQAIEKDPKRSSGYWRLAVLQDRRGNVQESATLFRQALQLDPKNTDLRCDYGYSLYLQRRWAEAEEQLRQALAISPQNRRAHNNLGLLLAQHEQGDAALSEFRQGGCSADAAHVNLAFASMLNQRWQKAQEEFQRALDANPGSAAAREGQQQLDSLLAKMNSAEPAPAFDERGAGPAPPLRTASAAPASVGGARPAGPVR